MKIMNGTKAIRGVIAERKVRQSDLAVKLCMSHNVLSENINRNRMSLGNFCKILDAMGYDVVVVDRETGKSVCRVMQE